MDLTSQWDLHHRQMAGTDQRLNVGISAPTPTVGDPVTFSSGQFAGRTIRVELQELQKAESGRKKVLPSSFLYAKVDRRPLDPPPAIELRLYETNAAGGQWEQELLPESVLNVGLICSVDLFPVPESVYSSSRSASGSQSPPGSSSDYRSHHPANAGGSNDLGEGHSQQAPYPLTHFPLHPYSSIDVNSGANAPPATFQIPRRQLMLGHLSPYDVPNDVVHRIGSHLITESSKLTPALVGERVVEPTLVDHQGRKSLIFVFGDLAVRREGVFILRYRVFDLLSGVMGNPDSPALAELFGGPFKVYSTREFPGLDPSTELTKNLSKYGVRVTLRDAERKSKKRTKE